MTDLLAARSQMAMSLAFHIIFASIGVAMPLMMAIAEWRWLRTNDAVFLGLRAISISGNPEHHNF